MVAEILLISRHRRRRRQQQTKGPETLPEFHHHQLHSGLLFDDPDPRHHLPQTPHQVLQPWSLQTNPLTFPQINLKPPPLLRYLGQEAVTPASPVRRLISLTSAVQALVVRLPGGIDQLNQRFYIPPLLQHRREVAGIFRLPLSLKIRLMGCLTMTTRCWILISKRNLRK